MTSVEASLEVLKVAATFAAAWAAIRIEIRWLRADVNRAHTRLDSHDTRINKVELKSWRGR